MKIIKFTAPWCSQCKAYSNVVKTVCSDHNITLEEVDCDESPDLAEQYHIRSVPTVISFDDEGNQLTRISGARTEDELINQLNLK